MAFDKRLAEVSLADRAAIQSETLPGSSGLLTASPDQEQPEAMLTLLGWAGLGLLSLSLSLPSPVQPSPAHPKNGRRRC